jgi:retron-type reverse transcriptase
MASPSLNFEPDLKNNLFKVRNRMSSGTYFPPAVRAVEIPKQRGGGTRMLGIQVHLIASGDAVQVQ